MVRSVLLYLHRERMHGQRAPPLTSEQLLYFWKGYVSLTRAALYPERCGVVIYFDVLESSYRTRQS